MCCHFSCPFSSNTAIGFHTECRSLIVNFSPRIFEMTEYSFELPIEPLANDDARRRQRTIELLLHKLKEHKLFKKAMELLPLELLCSVVDQVILILLRECTVVSIHAQLLNNWGLLRAQPVYFHHNLIDVCHNVYAEFVTLEGLQYVKSLRNSTTLQAVGKEVLLLNIEKTAVAETLYVAEDHLGIRMVILGRPNRSPPDSCISQGLWWSTMEINTDTKLEVVTDVRLMTTKLCACLTRTALETSTYRSGNRFEHCSSSSLEQVIEVLQLD